MQAPALRRFARLTAVLLAVALVVMPQLRYQALRTSIFDLGQYTTFIFNVFHGDGAGYAVQTHANLFILPYALVYELAPSPATLLFIQSIVLVAAAWPIYAYWVRKVGSGGEWAVLLHFLSISVWYNALFDFHFEHLLFLFVPLFFLVADRNGGKWRTPTLFFLALAVCGTKEVYALTAAAMGVWLALRQRERMLGWSIAAMSMAYFLVMTTLVIPAFTYDKAVGEIWGKAFGHLGQTPPKMLLSIISHPVGTAELMFGDPQKLIYTVILLGMLAFVPLLAPIEAAVAIPPLALALLSREPNHYALGHQYTAGVAAPLFLAMIVALGTPRLKQWRAALMLGAILASTTMLVAIGPSPLSRLFWLPKVWGYEAAAYWPTERDAQVARLIARYVPVDPEVSVSTQNTVNTARLVTRRHAFPFPVGVFEPTAVPNWNDRGSTEDSKCCEVFADYIVLDLQRPWFIRDRGCDWYWGSCQSEVEAGHFAALVTQVREQYQTIVQWNDLIILKNPGAQKDGKATTGEPVR